MGLQEAEMELVDQDVCQRKWANHPTNPQQIHAESVCVGPVGKDTATICHGDSGGPLVCETTSGWTVFGSTSFADFKGDECSSKEYPNVYIRMQFRIGSRRSQPTLSSCPRTCKWKWQWVF